MIVVDLSEVGHLRRVGDQLRIVVTGVWCGGRRLDPLEFFPCGKHPFRQCAKRSVCVGNLFDRLVLCGRGNEFDARYGVLEAADPAGD